MITILLSMILSGDICASRLQCVQRVAIPQQRVQFIQQQQHHIVQQHHQHHQQAIQDPYWASYPVGEQQYLEQRLSRLEEITALALENQRRLIEGSSNQAVIPPIDPIASKVQSIFSNNCTLCHSGDSPKKGLDLSQPLTPGQKVMVMLMVEDGSMPPPPKNALEDDDVLIIKQWVHRDRKELRQMLRGTP